MNTPTQQQQPQQYPRPVNTRQPADWQNNDGGDDDDDDDDDEPETDTTEPTAPEVPQVDPDTDTGDNKKKIPQ
ncbi:hypothetical protein [Deminuibacter soli]|uniref:Uncharacterized protein n=1 Tax=Deminuibacter soli TaxID=2291815 RepID=A0A3E1NJE0_9BACT|nr:hypothetical protein [Deminuibacter soli]RFM28050.1 hypothetical protein DXN05_10960 [Deminuibacter soli]